MECMKSLLIWVGNIYKGYTYKRGFFKYVIYRRSICYVCPLNSKNVLEPSFLNVVDYIRHKVGKIGYCTICKCPIKAKTQVEEEQCPKNKWTRIKLNQIGSKMLSIEINDNNISTYNFENRIIFEVLDKSSDTTRFSFKMRSKSDYELEVVNLSGCSCFNNTVDELDDKTIEITAYSDDITFNTFNSKNSTPIVKTFTLDYNLIDSKGNITPRKQILAFKK